MITKIIICNILFELDVDENIYYYLKKRIQTIETSKIADVKVICKRKKRLRFHDDKFLDQQEPDINTLYLYREIFDLGKFRYNRIKKILNAEYMEKSKYPYNRGEVVVDTLLQFIYLIMIDFNIIPLHASVVTNEKNAILIFGNSGAGKTTLELSLLNSGFYFYCDDVAFLDHNNEIYSSSEFIIACSKQTINMIKGSVSCIEEKGIDTINKKTLIPISFSQICQHEKVIPVVIIFADYLNDSGGKFCQISSKDAFINLIKLSISSKFDSNQKKLYIKRLKSLSENSISYEYQRNNNSYGMLEAVCCQMKEIMQKETYNDG